MQGLGIRADIKAKIFVAHNFRNLCKPDKSYDLKEILMKVHQISNHSHGRFEVFMPPRCSGLKMHSFSVQFLTFWETTAYINKYY